MVDSNKILTVSYGTFSCTLEGFDDAFETMKAIAEYFRDLAAEDRFFGAEPPTPDAEMLARIAERGSTRRVAASASDEGVVLRPEEERPAPVAAAPAPVEEPVAQPAPQAPAPAPAPVLTPPNHDPRGDGAQLHPAVAESHDAAEPEADAPQAVENAFVPAGAEPQEEVFAEIEDETELEAEAVAEDPAHTEAFGAETWDEDTEAEDDFEVNAFASDDFDAEEDFEQPEAEAPEAETLAPASGEDSIVAKLRRIRAVVSRNRAERPAPDFLEDQHADEYVEDDIFGRDALQEATVTAADDELAEEELSEGPAEAGFDQDADLLDEEESATDFSAGPEADDEDAFFDDTAQEDAEDIDTAAAEAPVHVHVAKVKRSERAAVNDADEPRENRAMSGSSLSPEEEAELQGELAALEAEMAAEAEEAAWLDSDDEDADFSEPAAFDHETAEAPVAVEYEDEDGFDEEDTLAEDVYADDEEDDDAEWERALSSDTPEFEEDAEVEAEPAVAEHAADEPVEEQEPEAIAPDLEADVAVEPESLDEPDAPEEHAAPEAAEQDQDEAAELVEDENQSFAEDEDDSPAGPAGREKLAASASPGDMDRILAETNNQLDDGEGTRRRSAIAHLRAAVAATKAEKEAGSDLSPAAGDTTDAYRQDLAQVVRPRRPRSSGTPSRRLEDKPAPLRLVAEQRVDIEAEHREPVRPRRVSVADLMRREAEEEVTEGTEGAKAAEGEGFPAFLENSGATELGEVLEAAAAYLAFVEGREQFSRPQLMSRVREVDPEGFSRENALRAFGTLLREGKIRKVKGGRFTASDRIGFQPDERAVG